MSREHKYRAWDTRRKKMWSAEEMGRDQLTLSPDGRGFINVPGKSTWLSTYLDHLIPLQFTGLLDKNGVEIYEGDIVRHSKAHLGTVVYHICECTMGFQIEGEGFYDYMGPLWSRGDIEVIGNIHDHPELLEG